MRFLCDAMLGHLARDLRALGHDTVLAGDEADEELVQRCTDEDRILVTMDQAIEPAIVLTNAADPLAQLAAHVDLGPSAFLSRCLVCNGAVVDADATDVPQDARPPFTHCPTCHRTYWRGSHTDAMAERLAAYL